MEHILKEIRSELNPENLFLKGFKAILWAFFTKKIHPQAYLFETCFGLGMLTIINLVFFPSFPGFYGIEPHPFWVVILLMATRYGFRAAFFASAAAALTFFVLLGNALSAKIVTARDLLEWTYAKDAILFLVAGNILGILIQLLFDRQYHTHQNNRALTDENQNLKQALAKSNEMNREFSKKLITADETLPLLFHYVKKFSITNELNLLALATELTQKVTQATQVCAYLFEKGEWILHSSNGQLRKNTSGKKRLQLPLGLQRKLIDQQQLIHTEDLANLPPNTSADFYLCGPIVKTTANNRPKTIGLIAIEQLDFIHYAPSTERLFKLVLDWVNFSMEQMPLSKTATIANEEPGIAPMLTTDTSPTSTSKIASLKLMSKEASFADNQETLADLRDGLEPTSTSPSQPYLFISSDHQKKSKKKKTSLLRPNLNPSR